jgi:hypothetical protein
MRDAVWQWWNTLPNDRATLEKILFGDYNEVPKKNSAKNLRAGTHDYFDCIRSGAQNGDQYWECNPTCVNPIPLENGIQNLEGALPQMKNPHYWDGKNVF